MFRRTTQFLVMLLAVAGPVAAQEPAPKPDAKLVLQAFEQYEMVRVALAADKLADVAPHAKELAAAIEPVGGIKAAKAAAALVTAKDIEVARKHFADLSTAVCTGLPGGRNPRHHGLHVLNEAEFVDPEAKRRRKPVLRQGDVDLRHANRAEEVMRRPWRA